MSGFIKSEFGTLSGSFPFLWSTVHVSEGKWNQNPQLCVLKSLKFTVCGTFVWCF